MVPAGGLGLVSTPAGILIDRYGGRLVMAAGSLLCGTGFILLSRAQSALGYVAAWTVLGLAMSAVLYEAAFATLIHRFGAASRFGRSPRSPCSAALPAPCSGP
ncbi:hypothetical protein LP419_15005 [Massilia sp. H-1]|nr:hypothetical protein LP419_15005 [Massilia sp. H-1]